MDRRYEGAALEAVAAARETRWVPRGAANRRASREEGAIGPGPWSEMRRERGRRPDAYLLGRGGVGGLGVAA